MPKRKLASGYDLNDIPLIGIQYAQKKETIKELSTQCEQLRVPLEKYLTEHGKADAKGSKICVVSHADVDVVMMHTLRVSSSLVENAEEVLKAHGLESCIKTVTYVDQEEIQKLHSLGELSNDVLAELYTVKESTAFSVTLKNTMKDEEDTV